MDRVVFIYEIAKETLQMNFEGNCCDSFSKTKQTQKRMSAVITLCVTHKVSDHHLHHEWQQLAALNPH
jgi:hypothetical protein